MFPTEVRYNENRLALSISSAPIFDQCSEAVWVLGLVRWNEAPAARLILDLRGSATFLPRLSLGLTGLLEDKA